MTTDDESQRLFPDTENHWVIMKNLVCEIGQHSYVYGPFCEREAYDCFRNLKSMYGQDERFHIALTSEVE